MEDLPPRGILASLKGSTCPECPGAQLLWLTDLLPLGPGIQSKDAGDMRQRLFWEPRPFPRGQSSFHRGSGDEPSRSFMNFFREEAGEREGGAQGLAEQVGWAGSVCWYLTKYKTVLCLQVCSEGGVRRRTRFLFKLVEQKIALHFFLYLKL